MADPWDPGRYNKFRAERLQPVVDLVGLVEPEGVARVLDLGCGTGEPTALLMDRLPGAVAVGLDRSAAMLSEARRRNEPRVTFTQGDLQDFRGWGGFDLVFSNAALQWVADHVALFPPMLHALPPRAQVAIQMPHNVDQPHHRIGEEVAALDRFRRWFPGASAAHHVQPLERYATWFHDAGFTRMRVEERVYPHVLDDVDAVVEWVRGTALHRYLPALPPADAEAFLSEYRRRLRSALGDARPCFFPFRRVLLWARKGG